MKKDESHRFNVFAEFNIFTPTFHHRSFFFILQASKSKTKKVQVIIIMIIIIFLC